MPRKFTGDTLVLATHNKKKVEELRVMLAGRVQNILCAADLNLPEPPETGTTFLENAMIKARTAAKRCQWPVLAEDSGLCVDALGGDPGVYTADWAGYPRNFRASIQRVLFEIRNASNRKARFHTTMVLGWPDGHTEVTDGQVEGEITRTPRGLFLFGYDPIFMPNGYAKTFAEMTPAQKNGLSHRARALEQLLKKCF